MGLELSSSRILGDARVAGLKKSTVETLQAVQKAQGKIDAHTLQEVFLEDGELSLAETELLRELLQGAVEINVSSDKAEFEPTNLAFELDEDSQSLLEKLIAEKSTASESDFEPQSEIEFPELDTKGLKEAMKKSLEESGAATADGTKKPAPFEKNKPEGPKPPPLDRPPGLLNKKDTFDRAEWIDDGPYKAYINAQKEVYNQWSEHHTKPAKEVKQLIFEKTLENLFGEDLKKLPPAEAKRLKAFLAKIPIAELLAAERQGMGGKKKGDGVTGTGINGHYTNSILTSVQHLMQNNRLTPEVMTSLEKSMKAPLHDELKDQRLPLVRSILQEVAFPSKVDQHARGTCAAATVQILYAIKAPAKYIDLVMSLASPSGKVPKDLLHNAPHSMHRDENTLKADDSGRSLSSRLMQPAFMEYANGSIKNYDNKSDDHYFGFINIGGGLYQNQTSHLAKALMGQQNYEAKAPGILGPSNQEFMDDIAKIVNNGEPVPVGMRWRDSGHEVLLTKVDKKNNLAYFMNPWGKLQTMPLDEMTERLTGASMPQKPLNNGKSALENLPSYASNPKEYTAVDREEYCTREECFRLNPAIKQHFSEDQIDQLVDVFNDLELPGYWAVTIGDAVSQNPYLGQAFIDQLKDIKDADTAMRFVRLNTRLSQSGLSNGIKSKILAAHPETHLGTKDFEDLLKGIENSKPADIQPLVKKAHLSLLQETTGLKDVSKLTQKDITAQFKTVMGGWRSSDDYLKVEYLASAADPKTKAAMIRHLMDGNTPEQAEKAIGLILANATPSEQQAVLKALDMKRLGNEMENADRAADILKLISKAGFKPSLLESHLNTFFDGVSDQSWFFNLFNNDDDTAMSFLQKLDNKSLKALPDSIKTRFFKALDGGHTSSSEYKAMRRVAAHMRHPKHRAALIKHMLNQTTYKEDEQLIAQMIKDTPAKPGKNGKSEMMEMLKHLDVRKIVESVGDDSLAADIGVSLIKGYQAAGRKPIAGKVSDYLRMLAYEHRDDAIRKFADHPSLKANKRKLYMALDAKVIKEMVNYLMDGYTSEGREDTIMKLMSKTSWEQYGKIMGGKDDTFRKRLGDELDSHDIKTLDSWTAKYNEHMKSKRTKA